MDRPAHCNRLLYQLVRFGALSEDIVAPGGVIANIGVHGVKADLHLGGAGLSLGATPIASPSPTAA
jgi:hypothetical protein